MKKRVAAPAKTRSSTRIRRVTRPTVAEIDLNAIKFNLQGIRRRVGKHVKIMAVVKANAYGHGIEEVSKAVEGSLTDYFGVATAEEGVVLREAGIRKPIHVFTLPTRAQAELAAEFDLEPTVCSSVDVNEVDAAGRRAKKRIPVHLKIETGMNRIGVKLANLGTLLGVIGKARFLDLKGVFTHFATADESDKRYVRLQLDELGRALEVLSRHRVEPGLVHCANSAAILDTPESYFSMVRPGMSMYGYYPSRTTSESIPLTPAMTLKSVVSLVKRIGAGESVSYGRQFIAGKSTTIATLPLGYADGISRLYTGKASVLIGGREFPIVGRICMDQLMVDVGDSNVAVGDEAVLIGTQGEKKRTAWDWVGQLETIPYELLCSISARVPRVYRT